MNNYLRRYADLESAVGLKVITPVIVNIKNNKNVLFVPKWKDGHTVTLIQDGNFITYRMYSATFTATEDTTLDVYYTKESYDNGTPDEVLTLTTGDNEYLFSEDLFRFGIITYDPTTGSRSGGNNKISKFIIDGCLTDGYRFLDEASNGHALTYVDLTNLDTSKMTTFFAMFLECSNLTNIGDLSNWNTDNVTDTTGMFRLCNVSSIGDLSSWNVSNVTSMLLMFFSCSSLTSIGDLSSWNVGNVTTTKLMFYNCSSLTTLGDLSSWNAPKCTNAYGMFAGDDNHINLTELSLGNLFKNGIVTDLSYIFDRCSSLTSVGDLSFWNVSNVTTTLQMFYNCKSLTTLGDLSSWNMPKCTTAKSMFAGGGIKIDKMRFTELKLDNLFKNGVVTDLSLMFLLCKDLTSVGDLSSWNVSNVKDTQRMFNHCISLTTVGDLSSWNMPKCTTAYAMFGGDESMNFTELKLDNLLKNGIIQDISFMFNRCVSLTSVGDLSSWNVSNVTTTELMFYDCSSLTTLGDLSSWNMPKCTTAEFMFGGGGSEVDKMRFTELKLDNLFKNGVVTDLTAMFLLCEDLTSVGDLSSWNVSNVTIMQQMFCDCTSLTSVGDLSSWDVSKVTTMENMFYNCTSLTSVGDLSSWDVSNVTTMQLMFVYCTSLTTLGDLSSWDVSKVTSFRCMFCENSYVGDGKLTDEFVSTLASWNVSSCTDFTCMFYGQAQVTTYPFSSWNTSSSTSFNHMFCDNFKLTSIDMSLWNTKNVKSVYNMFNDCTSLISVGNISNWDTSSLIDCSNMFCIRSASLTGKIDLSGWTTPVLRSCENMFEKCSGLTEIDLSNMNTTGVNSKTWTGVGSGIYYNYGTGTMNNMFVGCTALTTIKFGPNFDNSNTTMTDAFKDCTSLTTITGLTNIGSAMSFADCPLTRDSALVVLNALSSTKTSSITFSSTTYALLSDEDIAIGTTKGWSISA